MRFRLSGFRIKGFRRRRAKGMHDTSKTSLSSKAKSLVFVTESPVYASGNLSLPMALEQVHPSNLLPVKGLSGPPNHVNQRVFTGLSPPSPLPSSALTTTPMGHNTPLALKDLLGFEAVDGCRKPSLLAHYITSSLSCCRVGGPETKSGPDCQKGNVNEMRDQRDQGVLQGLKSKWTGLCPYMFVSAEKQIVKKGSDHAWRVKPGQTTRVESGSCSAAMEHVAVSNGQTEDSGDGMQASGMNAITIGQEFVDKKIGDVARVPSTSGHGPSWDRVRPAAELNSSSISTPFQLEAWSALPGHRLLLAKDKNLKHASKPARQYISHQTEKLSVVYEQSSAQAMMAKSALPKGKSSVSDELETRYSVTGGLDDPSKSLSSISKAHRTGALHYVTENAQRSVPFVRRWRRGDGKNHEEQPMGNHGLALWSTTDPHLFGTNQSTELGSEEESSLLQADSYESSDTFSVSSGLNDQPKPVPSPNVSIDLEARARPWASTENHAGIPAIHCKSVSNLKKSKREHTTMSSLIESSHHGAFMAHPIISNRYELKTDHESALPAEIADGNQELKVSTSAHDCNANLRNLKGIYTQKQVTMQQHQSESNSEIRIANHERNPACSINNGVRKACKLVSTHRRSKFDTIMLPSHKYANQELNNSSAHAFIPDEKDEQHQVAHARLDRASSPRAKSHTIMLPSQSSTSKANMAQEQIPPHSAAHISRQTMRAKEMLAVEKKSRDPYVDFIDSMLDMILQNHLCSCQELEGLLQSFLSLNPPEHHDVIVQAFTEVWDKVVVARSA